MPTAPFFRWSASTGRDAPRREFREESRAGEPGSPLVAMPEFPAMVAACKVGTGLTLARLLQGPNPHPLSAMVRRRTRHDFEGAPGHDELDAWIAKGVDVVASRLRGRRT